MLLRPPGLNLGDFTGLDILLQQRVLSRLLIFLSFQSA